MYSIQTKSFFQYWVIFSAIVLTSACSKSEGEKKADTVLQKWPEEEAFHIIIAETFHPMDNDSNFTPIRTRSEELLGAAQKWIQSKPPYDLAHPEGCAEALVKLLAATESLHKQVQSGAGDDEIRKSLTALHDLFHEAREESAPKGTAHSHKH